MTAAGSLLTEGTHDLVWVTGAEAVAFLDGQLSQAIEPMAVGGVARSLLLEPRGKLRALLFVLRGEQRVGLVADAGFGEVVAEGLDRFRFRVAAEIAADDRPLVMLWGPGSGEVLDAAGLPAPTGWVEKRDVVVAAFPGVTPRFLVVGAEAGSLFDAGARSAGGEAVLRIEAGEPRMGVDVDEGTIPQETGLVPEAVDFTKGCYLGQELVARIDSRGHVNRHLRGVVLGDGPAPPAGAEVVAGGEVVGTLTSVGESASHGAVGMGLVRREAEPGQSVEVRWPGGSAGAEIRALPLISG